MARCGGWTSSSPPPPRGAYRDRRRRLQDQGVGLQASALPFTLLCHLNYIRTVKFQLNASQFPWVLRVSDDQTRCRGCGTPEWELPAGPHGA